MSKTSQALQTAPVSAGASQESFTRYLMLHPNPKDALDLVSAQAGLDFDRDSGGALDRLALERSQIELDLTQTEARLSELTDHLSQTEEFIPVPGADSGVPFRQWPTEDRFQLIAILMVLLALLAMSATAVYSNLMASGIPVLLETPFLAWVLSALAPAASFTLHYGGSLIEHRRLRQRFDQSLFAIAALLILAWTVLFACTYTGITGELDLASFTEGSATASWLVWTQLAAEITTAGCLFTIAERLCAKHRPLATMSNPSYREIEFALRRCESQRERLRLSRAEVAMQQRQLLATREAAANLAVARYLAHRARFNAFQAD